MYSLAGRGGKAVNSDDKKKKKGSSKSQYTGRPGQKSSVGKRTVTLSGRGKKGKF